MKSVTRFVLGLVILTFGFFCLNYTNGFGITHHAEWAASRQLPAPSYAIYVAGALLEAIGAGLCGHALGRRKNTR